jgi:FMNH2-dependent dimethyl sulfone monooxygenase
MNETRPHPLRNANPFKLGLFSVNADGGLAFTNVENRWRADWDEIVTAAKMADDAGIEFILPIARWKGYGGETNARGTSYETLTHAAGLAALTRSIAIFATVHVPLVHPVFAAKALATIDHISHGRAGLNIVCGWNQAEFDMFGHSQTEHDGRYDQGLEWYEIWTRVYEGGEPFDYHGKYYDLKGVVGDPGPHQRPRPFTMSAASSATGRAFAAKTSDLLFTTIREPESAAARAAAFKASVKDRDVGLFTTCHVVCRETDAEAEEYYRFYAEERADTAAVDYHMKVKQAHYHAVDPHIYRVERRRFAGGTGTHPLIGSPARIVDEMRKLQKLGFAGTTISFVNFNDELPFFVDRVLPLMRQEGLRVA